MIQARISHVSGLASNLLVRVCSHAPVTWEPACTVNTCDEDLKEVTGGPLHAIELEVTSEMNCAAY
jgi:hypothetical protein